MELYREGVARSGSGGARAHCGGGSPIDDVIDRGVVGDSGQGGSRPADLFCSGTAGAHGSDPPDVVDGYLVPVVDVRSPIDVVIFDYHDRRTGRCELK